MDMDMEFNATVTIRT